ncbi:hypothetical protein [Mucilaginibacter sp.]|jgi:hypothetical protein|uniref:hypothetical protein n=1 Tax=Mucilaginibacter sp. TaxID=1882438 RepID=UPI0035614678
MQYSDYIALYQAQKEREAQLVDKYSQTPEPALNNALWSVTAVERHKYPDTMLWLRVLACVAIFSTIIALYCAFA